MRKIEQKINNLKQNIQLNTKFIFKKFKIFNQNERKTYLKLELDSPAHFLAKFCLEKYGGEFIASLWYDIS